MSEAEIKSLETPFYSLKSKGTGLGLMICYNILGKYHDSIDFTSSKGEGTTVIVRFPLKKV
jgi:two-component system sporulation sensor kinase B